MKKYKKNWLKNKSVVITGASSGIGKELTKLLITKYDCKVIGIGRNEDKMKMLKSELDQKSDNFSYKLFDVSQKEYWALFQHHIEENNINIDVLINNAGVLPPFKRETEFSIDDFENTFNTNYFSYVYAIKHLYPYILKSDTPAIVNVSSSAGLCPVVGASVYSSTKAAIKNYVEVLQTELKGKMYVGLVCPGFVKTDLYRNQNHNMGKFVNMVALRSEKATKKILKGIVKQKKRMVIGIDAKFMDLMYRLFPRSTPKLIKNILKSSKIELFKDVFE